MKQSKFSLADVITLLTAVVFGFICFLGINFYTLGNTKQSILFSAIITVLLGGTAITAKLLKRTKGNFKTNFIVEVIVLFLFTALTALFAYSPFPHYFTVTAKKSEIQNNISNSITQGIKMFNAYEQYALERKYYFERNLLSVVNNEDTNPSEFEKLGFQKNGIPYQRQIDAKISLLHVDLIPSKYSDTINNNGIKEVATNWLEKAQDATENWKPISIVDVVNEIEKNSTDWQNLLVDISKIRSPGEPDTNNFEYELSHQYVKTHFTTLGKPTPMSIGLSGLAYLLMLLSWVVAKRDSRFPGFKMLFTSAKENGNEL
jgi:hypothetical protein